MRSRRKAEYKKEMKGFFSNFYLLVLLICRMLYASVNGKVGTEMETNVKSIPTLIYLLWECDVAVAGLLDYHSNSRIIKCFGSAIWIMTKVVPHFIISWLPL